MIFTAAHELWSDERSARLLRCTGVAQQSTSRVFGDQTRCITISRCLAGVFELLESVSNQGLYRPVKSVRSSTKQSLLPNGSAQ